MEIGATGSVPAAATMSLLKTANRMPELAGELIQKTLEAMATSPAAPTQSTATSSPPSPGEPGQMIDIFA